MKIKNYLIRTSLALIMSTALAFTTVSCTKKPEEKQKVEETQKESLEQKAEEGYIAPDFTLKNLEGKDVSLSDYDEKVILLNFWATWCGPCKAEMPDLNEFYKEYKDKGVEVVTINCWDKKKETVEKFLNKNGYSFEVLLDKDNKVTKLYGVRGIPSTFILDKNKKILKKIVRMYDFTNPSFKNWVDDLLKGEVKELTSEITAKDRLHARKKMLRTVFEDSEHIPKSHIQQHAFYIFDRDDNNQLSEKETETVAKELNIKPSKTVLNYEEFLKETNEIEKHILSSYVAKHINNLSENDLLDLLIEEFKGYLDTWPSYNKTLAEKIKNSTDQKEIEEYTQQLEDSQKSLSSFVRELAVCITDEDDDSSISPEEYELFAKKFGLKHINSSLSGERFQKTIEGYELKILIEYIKENFLGFTRYDMLGFLNNQK